MSNQSCLILCDPVDCSLPGFSVHGILQARILEWVTFSFSRGSSQPRDRTQVSCIVSGFFTTELPEKPIDGMKMKVKSLSHVRTLCDPMDCSLPGSSVHGICQARVLEWVAISFSWGSSQPRDSLDLSYLTSKCKKEPGSINTGRQKPLCIEMLCLEF